MSWKTVKYLRQGDTSEYDYELTLPEPLANWDVFNYWEKNRVYSMRDNLTKDDILFDVGAEHGWLSIVYAKFCHNIFLIEPTAEFWANIYQTWKRNVEFEPIGCFQGLLGAESNFKPYENYERFPNSINGEMITVNKYEYLHQHTVGIKTLSLDDLVKYSGKTPTALTIDVEGAELEVLKGGKNLLEYNDLKVWVSIHPDMMKRDYDSTLSDLIVYMKRLGYEGKLIGIDHEEHWYFRKSE